MSGAIKVCDPFYVEIEISKQNLPSFSIFSLERKMRKNLGFSQKFDHDMIAS